MRLKLGLVLMLVSCLPACATSFTGSAHVSSRAGCEWQCKKLGMVCTGMVIMGDYSSACVCSVPQTAGQGGVAAAAAAAGATGVMLQMRAAHTARLY
jgi:hypothetical protein